MLMKGHLAMGLFAGLLFLPLVNNKLSFIPIILIASLLPDLDVPNSYLGQKPIFRPLHLIFKHRGVIHSLTLCVFLSLISAWFFPVFALPFFLGYSVHLLVDSFTVEGISPFWPFKGEVIGKLKVGGKIEGIIFYLFVGLDFILLIRLFIL